jgi:gliding motility-associated-like protein
MKISYIFEAMTFPIENFFPYVFFRDVKGFRRLLFIFLTLVSATEITTAQLPVLHWSKVVIAAPSYNQNLGNARTIGTDALGNVYSAGLFQYTMDFDPGPGVFNMTAINASSNIYIWKLDVNGNFLWARQIPTYVEFGEIELKVEAGGNVYVTSNLHVTADMDPGAGVLMMSPTGFRDAFVIKLDAAGNLVWVKQFGGPGDVGPMATAIEIDKDNNILLCGQFNKTVDFDPGPGVYNLTSTAHFQAYIVKLNSNGDLIWAKQFGNSPIVYSGSQIADIKTDAQGNIFTTGGFEGTCDFDPGPGVFSLTGMSYNDGFISKLDINGNFIFAKSLSGTSYSFFMQARSIDLDQNGNLIIGGWLNGTYDMDPGSAVFTLTGIVYDAFVLKLNAQGNFLWARSIGGNDQDTGNDIELDANNNIYLAGSFGPTVDFDPGPGTHIITSPGYGASGIVKLSQDGNFVYAVTFPSPGGSSYGTSLFRRIRMGPAQNIHITGHLSGTIDSDPNPAVINNINSSYGQSPFVLKLGRCTNVSMSSLTISSCSSYTLNSKTYDSSGVYQQTIVNTAGCDSVITLNLTINNKTAQQTKEICEGNSFLAGGANQTTSGVYIDTLQTVLGCDSILTTYLTVRPKPTPNLGSDKNLCAGENIQLTPGSFTSYLWQDGSTGSNFTVNASGLYWVKVTGNFNCSATDSFKVANVFPLPSNFLKESDSLCSYETISLIPTSGFSGYQWSTGSTNQKLSINTPGVYWLKVQDANGCSGTDSIIVLPRNCMSGIYIPTAFSPNADGKNDVFKPLLFGVIEEFRFEIYDRWGQIIFKTTEPGLGWNGMLKGILSKPDVYIWLCHYKLNNHPARTEKGTVLLIR